jgi:hypothetical protein
MPPQHKTSTIEACIMQVRSIVTKVFGQPFLLFYDNGYGVIDFSFKGI